MVIACRKSIIFRPALIGYVISIRFYFFATTKISITLVKKKNFICILICIWNIVWHKSSRLQSRRRRAYGPQKLLSVYCFSTVDRKNTNRDRNNIIQNFFFIAYLFIYLSYVVLYVSAVWEEVVESCRTRCKNNNSRAKSQQT